MAVPSRSWILHKAEGGIVPPEGGFGRPPSLDVEFVRQALRLRSEAASPAPSSKRWGTLMGQSVI